jgi:hypothetical protein
MPPHDFIRRDLWRLAVGAVGLAATGGALAQAPQAVRVRATIDAVDAKSLSLTTRTGDKVTVALAPDTVVTALVPIKLEDIKPGCFIGSAAMPEADGTQRALEVHVFPESMRGTGEGHRPFDLQPQSTMTNGTVGSVTGSVGRTLTVAYKGGQKTIVVPPGTPVVTYEPGSPALLVPKAHVIIFGTQAADGNVTANRIAVGKIGTDRENAPAASTFFTHCRRHSGRRPLTHCSSSPKTLV